MSANLRALQHLAAAMAHEVRNPLNSMAIHAELLEGRIKRQPEGAEGTAREAALRSVRVMVSEIERVDRVLDEYLEQVGPGEANRHPVAPLSLLEIAADAGRATAEERGVTVALSAAGVQGDWIVDGDSLAEAVTALLKNAVEASVNGATVSMTARLHEDQGEIEIRDSGDGIVSEDLPQIFRLGFSRKGQPGIGLTVAKQIVKGHGGSIYVRSDGAGQGAIFTLRVPLDDERDENEQAIG